MVDFMPAEGYTSLSKWSKIPQTSCKEAFILLLTDGKPYLHFRGTKFDFTHDIAVFTHSLEKINSDGKILEINASFNVGEYESERTKIFGCAFNNGVYAIGVDYRDRSFLSLEEARKNIPQYLGISLDEFLKLFQIDGITESCKKGIREFLE